MDKTINRLQQLEEIPYPAPPWTMKGQLWMGTFKSDVPVHLPHGLHHFLDPKTLIVIVVRYLEGTLSYDEFAVGTLTRLGPRIGIYVDCIWVNSLASVWGGRHIWGLPKNMAEFVWQGSTVRITDEQGLIASVTVDMSPISSPHIWMPMPGVGRLENSQWVFTVGQLWASLGAGHMRIEEWPTRFGYQLGSIPTFSMAAKPFQMSVPAGKILKR